MKAEIVFNEYERNTGFVYTWYNNFSIKSEICNDTIHIEANKEGLLSLAANLISLAQDEVPEGTHIELDDYNSLEENSKNLIFERKDRFNHN